MLPAALGLPVPTPHPPSLTGRPYPSMLLDLPSGLSVLPPFIQDTWF